MVLSNHSSRSTRINTQVKIQLRNFLNRCSGPKDKKKKKKKKKAVEVEAAEAITEAAEEEADGGCCSGGGCSEPKTLEEKKDE